MKFLENILFIQSIADFFQTGYWIAFAVFFGACLVVLLILILLIVRRAGRKKRRERAAQRAAEKANAKAGKTAAPAAASQPPVQIAAYDPAYVKTHVPAEKPVSTGGTKEVESSYRSIGSYVPIKPDIDDRALLDIIYDEIISRRENISRSAFLADKDFCRAQLDYVNERLVRLQVRGLTTKEALDIYFNRAPLLKTERRGYHVLSELERQTMKQQKVRALEADIQTLSLHVTALEKTIEGLNEKMKAAKNKKRSAEIRQKISEYYKELEITRQQLLVMYEKGATDKAAVEKKAEPAPVTAAPQPQPIVLQTPAPQPVIIQTMVPQAPAPQPAFAVQYIDYALRAELTAELKALILLVNESQNVIKDLDFKNAASALNREHIRGEIERVNAAAFKAQNRAELDRCTSDAQLFMNELNSVILDMEICAGDKAQLSADIYSAHNRINEIIQKLGLSYQDVMKLEEDVLSGNKGVISEGATVDWNLAEAKRRADAAKRDVRSYIEAEQERARAYSEPPLSGAGRDTAAAELDELRKDYMRHIREMEQERIAFYRDFAKSAMNQNSGSAPQTIKQNSIVPPDYVMIRRADGSLAMMHRSRLPKNARPARSPGAVMPATDDGELRAIKRLPDGSVIRSDGSMLRPSGKVLRPKRPKDADTVDYREILMRERRELLVQRKAIQDAELLTNIQASLDPFAGGYQRPISAEHDDAKLAPAQSPAAPKPARVMPDPLEEEISKIENALKTGKKDGV